MKSKHWPEAIVVYPQGMPTAVPKIDEQGRYAGWQKFSGQQMTIAAVKRLNGCEGDGKTIGEGVTEYASTKDAPVVTYVHPGGHQVPDDAGKLISDFFKAHPGK